MPTAATSVAAATATPAHCLVSGEIAPVDPKAPAVGRVQFDVAEFYTLREDRIFEFRSFFDSFDLVQQLLGQDLTETFAARVKSSMRA